MAESATTPARILVFALSFFHITPAHIVYLIKHEPDPLKQEALLGRAYDMSTAAALFESIFQVGIAIMYLLYATIASRVEGGVPLSATKQVSMLASAAASVLAIVHGVYRLDRSVSSPKGMLERTSDAGSGSGSIDEENTAAHHFRTTSGSPSPRLWYHERSTQLHRAVEMGCVGGLWLLLFAVAAEAEAGSVVHYLCAAFFVLEWVGCFALILYKRCKLSLVPDASAASTRTGLDHPGDQADPEEKLGCTMALVSSVLVAVTMMFTNPIDKFGRPYAPWLGYYAFRLVFCILNWILVLTLRVPSSCSILTTTTAGFLVLAAAAISTAAWPLTASFLWYTRELKAPSTFWVGAGFYGTVTLSANSSNTKVGGALGSSVELGAEAQQRNSPEVEFFKAGEG